MASLLFRFRQTILRSTNSSSLSAKMPKCPKCNKEVYFGKCTLLFDITVTLGNGLVSFTISRRAWGLKILDKVTHSDRIHRNCFVVQKN